MVSWRQGAQVKVLRLILIALLVGAVTAFVAELLRPRRTAQGYHPGGLEWE